MRSLAYSSTVRSTWQHSGTSLPQILKGSLPNRYRRQVYRPCKCPDEYRPILCVHRVEAHAEADRLRQRPATDCYLDGAASTPAVDRYVRGESWVVANMLAAAQRERPG